MSSGLLHLFVELGNLHFIEFTGVAYSDSVSHNWVKELSIPVFLFTNPSARGRIIGFIPFPMVLVLSEMQSVSSRIWTRIALSISYDDNHYTTYVLLSIPVLLLACSEDWTCSLEIIVSLEA